MGLTLDIIYSEILKTITHEEPEKIRLPISSYKLYVIGLRWSEGFELFIYGSIKTII